MKGFQFTVEPAHIVSILKFLDANGASRFGFEWLVDYLSSRRFWPEVTIILAPTDMAIRRLEVESDLPFDKIVQSYEGLEILQNHLSISPTKTQWPMITALHGEKYGSSQADIEALKPSVHTLIETVDQEFSIIPLKTSVIVIDALIVHGDQLLNLKRYKGGFSKWWRPIDVNRTSSVDNTSLKGTELSKMNKDVFRMMVSTGQLRGKDVLSLCTGNKDIATMCDRDNYLLYQQLLKSEFNYEWRPTDLPVTAKDMYKEFHRYRLDVYAEPESAQYNYVEVIDDKVATDAGLRLHALYKSRGKLYDYFSIPLGHDFDIRDINIWVAYIKGRSRTAVLLRVEYEESYSFGDVYEVAYGRGRNRNDSDDEGEAGDAFIYMSSYDLRNFIGYKKIEVLDLKAPLIGSFVELILYMPESAGYSKEILLGGQKETVVMIPIERKALLSKR